MTFAGAPWHSVGAMKTLLAALVAALIVVATASASPPPKELVGKWTRTVSAADVLRAHARKVIIGTTWTLSITQRGSIASTPGRVPLRGEIIPSSPTQINIEIGQQKPNLYSWKRSGKSLALHAYADSIADRTAVLNGVWKKRPS